MTTATEGSTEQSSRRRVAFVVVDQAIYSGSNFLGGVLVARLAGVEAFGGYMLAYTVWLALLLLQRAIVLEPLIILHRRAEPHSPEVRNALAAGVSMGIVLGLGTAAVGAALVVAGSASAGGPLVAVGVSLPFLFLQDAWRGLAFKEGRPELAAVNDAVFTAVQIALLLALMTALVPSGAIAVAAWGAGAVAGSIAGVVQFRTWPSRRAADGFRGGWSVGRWLLAEVSTGQVAEQVSFLYVASRVGTAAFGGLRAGIALMGPTSILFHAGANHGLPEATRLVQQEGKEAAARLARRLTLAVGGVVWSYALVVIVGADWLLTTIYGSDFARYAGLTRIVAVSVGVIALAFGAQTVLKAARMARSLWVVRGIATAVGFATTVVLTSTIGVTGAAIGNLALSIGLTVGALVAFRRWERSSCEEALAAGGPAIDLDLLIDPPGTPWPPPQTLPPPPLAPSQLPTVPLPPAVVAGTSQS
jgi:O-antigen/teichoic acid export membrane protein